MLRYTISTLIIMVSLVVVMRVLADVSHPEDTEDPFAPYDALVPGQPATVLAQYPCQYAYIPPDIVENVVYCQIRPGSGPILLVAVTAVDDTIHGLTFSVTGLQAGHLAQRWGHPDVIRSGNGFSLLDWKAGISATVQTSGWFTYQSSLVIVILRNESTNNTLS